jgi:hypothetical protein
MMKLYPKVRIYFGKNFFYIKYLFLCIKIEQKIISWKGQLWTKSSKEFAAHPNSRLPIY